MKTTTGRLLTEIIVECPHCYEMINILELQNFRRYVLDPDSLVGSDLEIKVACPSCSQNFIVTDVIY